jgi:hypothetical protein
MCNRLKQGIRPTLPRVPLRCTLGCKYFVPSGLSSLVVRAYRDNSPQTFSGLRTFVSIAEKMAMMKKRM